MASDTTSMFDASLAYSPSSVDGASTALLLLDFHNFIVSRMGEQGLHSIKVASTVRDWARTKGIHVVHGLIDTQNLGDVQPQMKLAARRDQYQQALEKSPELGLEVDGISAAAKEDTHRRQLGVVSALSSPGIIESLRQKGIRSLIICGVSTSGCVLSTTRAATDLGFIVTVVEDACADPAPGVHEAMTNVVLPMTAHVASAQQLMDAWK